jgi:hypothetical protein
MVEFMFGKQASARDEPSGQPYGLFDDSMVRSIMAILISQEHESNTFPLHGKRDLQAENDMEPQHQLSDNQRVAIFIFIST